MGNVHIFTQHYRQLAGAMSGELGAETTIADAIQTPNFQNMANYDLVNGFAQVSHVVSAQVITLQMYEATDATGGGAQAVLRLRRATRCNVGRAWDPRVGDWFENDWPPPS